MSWQFGQSQYAARAAGQTAFVSMQNRYNLVNREEEREMIPFCLDLGVGIILYSPLARGLLAGTRERGGAGARHRAGAARTARSGADERTYRPADFDVVDAVRAVAASRGVPPARVALSWLLGRPGVVAPVIGATRPGHLDDALAAVDLQLDDAEAGQLEAPYAPHPPGGYT
jgi:aryl-alcohol dehydrogenase-like predicted oxidoreductase